jgi:low affinity Fe/Cu permease
MRTSKARAVDPLGSMPSTNTPVYAAHSRLLSAFDSFSSHVTRWAGSPIAFAGALCLVIVWAAMGRVFDYSENWQLHLKLNELLAASKQASNRMIGIEGLDEQDLREVADFYVRLAARAEQRGRHKETHSIDEEGMPTDG